jgi:hypothetical protein
MTGIGVDVEEELEPESAADAALEVELAMCETPPHPDKISANKQRPMPCSRITSSSTDEAAQVNFQCQYELLKAGEDLRRD